MLWIQFRVKLALLIIITLPNDVVEFPAKLFFIDALAQDTAFQLFLPKSGFGVEYFGLVFETLLTLVVGVQVGEVEA